MDYKPWEEINPFLPNLLVVMMLYHSNRNPDDVKQLVLLTAEPFFQPLSEMLFILTLTPTLPLCVFLTIRFYKKGVTMVTVAQAQVSHCS